MLPNVNDPTFPPEVRFEFPLAHPQIGIVVGNGKLNICVWGDEFLCLSIARSRVEIGGSCNRESQSNELYTMLAAQDVAGVKRWLANSLEQPTSIESAHLELRFAGEVRPATARLGSDGILQIAWSDGRVVTLECAMDEEVAWLDGAAEAEWELRFSSPPDDEAIAPLEIQMDDGRGMIWENSGENSSVAMVRKREQQIFIATAAGEIEEAAKAAVSLARNKPDINPVYFWRQYWRAAPRIAWPEAQLQRQWDIALGSA